MNKPKKILFAPLDWGIGHASRCVPIIRLLTAKGAEVILATSGRSASFLKAEFPGLQHIYVPGYDISYPHHGSMALRMLRRSPVILSSIRREHRALESIIDQYGIDAVISDNRFGMWSSRIPSIYITHQVTIKAPPAWSFTEGLLYMMHRKYIKYFDECWIPDNVEEGGLSGDLAHKRECPGTTYFIGPQSRFELPPEPVREKKYDLMFIISGPEPQRSIFEEIIMEQLNGSNFKSLVLLGKPESKEKMVKGQTEVHSHMGTREIQEAMLASELIICRPGYSSIMDLSALGKKAVLVPTPGQTEQEYLAAFHQYRQHYYTVDQSEFNIARCIEESRNYNGLGVPHEDFILNDRLDTLLLRL